jgi:phosphoribosyl-dephospho-CoA transferase
MSDKFLAHDLLWLKVDTPQRHAEWFAGLPLWARERILRRHPLVVRRELAPPGGVAVGLRGYSRAERFGCFIPAGEIARRMSPPELHGFPLREGRQSMPALKAWEDLRHSVSVLFPWGPSGSTAYELATGTDVVSATSDLDLVLYVPHPLTRREATRLLTKFEHPACHCDVQIAMPSGSAFALREWERGDARVLVKTPQGPVLSNKPWSVETTV